MTVTVTDNLTDNLDPLVREDMVLGEQIAKLEKSKNFRMMFYAQRAREDTEPLDRQLKPLEEKRRQVRETILGLWSQGCPGTVTLDLPCAKVSRRNYRELVVKDREALMDALDRADRLDLLSYTVDEKAVAHLILQKKLPGLPKGAVELKDHHNLQVRPRKESDLAGPQPKA